MSGRRGRRQPLPANAIGTLPVVAIVGRPNVGKSTLFNRLIGQRLAIVEDTPGVTRDRHYGDARILGRECVIIDTGGFDPDSDDPLAEGITGHVMLALDEADVIVCVFDGTTPTPAPADVDAVKLLRGSSKPVVYVANKADSQKRAHGALSLYELGMETLIPVSAAHGRGIGTLEDAIHAVLPPPSEEPKLEVPEGTPRLAIVGRPNAGKSSLVNRILGEDRQLVDHRPGTTVDSIDALIHHRDEPLVLIDTAGIRRKRSVKKVQGVEGLGVLKAIRAMERADAVVLMIDGDEGVAEQDARLAGLAVDRGRALIIGVNKADLLDRERRHKAMTRAREVLAFAPWAPMVALSAKTGRGTRKLLDAVKSALVEWEKRVTTAEVNRFFEEVLEHHPPPVHKGRAVRLYFVTQAQVRPPTFVVSTNEPNAVHFSYRRYVVNQLRQRFGFAGTPVRVFYRGKSRKKRESD